MTARRRAAPAAAAGLALLGLLGGCAGSAGGDGPAPTTRRPTGSRAPTPTRGRRRTALPRASRSRLPRRRRAGSGAARPHPALPRRRPVGEPRRPARHADGAQRVGGLVPATAPRRCRCSPPACTGPATGCGSSASTTRRAREVRRAVRRGLRRAVPVGARRGRRPGRARPADGGPPQTLFVTADGTGRRPAASARSGRRRSWTGWCSATSASGCDAPPDQPGHSRSSTTCPPGCGRSRRPRCTSGPNS